MLTFDRYSPQTLPNQEENKRKAMCTSLKVRLFLALACFIVIGAVVAAVVVTLTKNDNTLNDENQQFIKVEIQLDEKPEETGSNLNCSDKEVASVPPGFYANQKPARIIHTVQVQVDDECSFTLTDAGGDGIDGGFYTIYSGTDTSAEGAILAEGSGDFEYYSLSWWCLSLNHPQFCSYKRQYP